MSDLRPGDTADRPLIVAPSRFARGGAAVALRQERELDQLIAPREATLSRRDSVRRRLLALADVLALCTAGAIVSLIMGPGATADDELIVLIAALPGWVLLNKVLGLYDRDANLIHKSTLDELPQILHSVALGAGLIYLIVPPLTNLGIDRTKTVLFGLAALALMPAFRSLVRTGVQKSFPPERALIVGTGTVTRLVARKLRAHPEYGTKLVGAVDVLPSDVADGEGDPPRLGGLAHLEDLCREFRVERVVIAFSSLSHEDLLDAIRASKNLNLKITVVPRLYEVIGRSVEIDQIEGMTMLGLRGLSRTRSSLMLKRAIDVAGSTLGLIFLSPLLLSIAIAVKLTSPGPILYAHHRIGRGNTPFKLYKFRTMVRDADDLKAELAHLNEASHPMFKIADDPRITRFGRFLRRTSLDELPQLFNVLRGEMSLVGPRPLVPFEDDHVIGWHRARLDLTPGLTGPWQVMGRTAIPFQEMIKIDYLYVADWSLWNDVKLLLRTAAVVLKGDGR